MDFSEVPSIKLKENNHLELLAVSISIVNDGSFKNIIQSLSELRYLDVSWNRISNLKTFVTNFDFLNKLKVTVSFSDPVSFLPIYYSYITDHIDLA
jgi:Leucine-rich repeat (LRR) protein